MAVAANVAMNFVCRKRLRAIQWNVDAFQSHLFHLSRFQVVKSRLATHREHTRTHPKKKFICHFVSSLTVNVAHYMTATTYNNHKPTSTYTHPRTLTLIRSIKSITTTPSNHLTKLTAVKHFIIRWDIAAEGESECARVFRWEFSRF